MSRTITITGKDRPLLFRDLLISLAQNDLTGWRIAIAIDGPRGQEFSEIARAVLPAAHCELTENLTPLGITRNPYELLSRVFDQGSTLNLYLEEDLLVAPDATRMALWYDRNHRLGWACLNLISGPCGSAGLLSAPAYPELLFEAHSFNALGFVARRAEWHALFAPVWLRCEEAGRGRGGFADWRTRWGWDWSVYGVIVDGDFVSVQPALARATHCAPGTYCTQDFQDEAFAGMALASVVDPTYRVVATADLPQQLRAHLNLHRELSQRLVQLERAAATA